jgi:oxygen-independent coproporphyrinogen-3 oxidase
VIYEDDTPLFKQLAAGEISIDEDLACAMHEKLVERATSAASSNTKSPISPATSPASRDDVPSRACRHNVNYWRGGSYYGLGPSAAGYVRGVRTKNWSNTQLYCERLERGERAIETVEELPALKRAGETAAFGLRMNAGWPSSSSAPSPALTSTQNGAPRFPTSSPAAGLTFPPTTSASRPTASASPTPPPKCSCAEIISFCSSRRTEALSKDLLVT